MPFPQSIRCLVLPAYLLHHSLIGEGKPERAGDLAPVIWRRWAGNGFRQRSGARDAAERQRKCSSGEDRLTIPRLKSWEAAVAPSW